MLIRTALIFPPLPEGEGLGVRESIDLHKCKR